MLNGAEAWEEFLPLLELAFNVTINTATGLAPAFVIHGRQLRLPMDALVEPHGATPPKLPDWVDERLEQGRAAITEAFRVLHRNAMASKKRYDLKHDVNMKFRVGQQVILVKGTFIDGNLPKGEEPTFETIYTVSRVLGNDNYELQTRAGHQLKGPVHVTRMLPACTPLDFSAEKGAAEYPVECIVDRRQRVAPRGPRRGESIIEYRVKWVGYGRNYGAYWYPAEFLGPITELVAAYNSKHPLPPSSEPTPAELRTEFGEPVHPGPTEEAASRPHFRRRPDAAEEIEAPPAVSEPEEESEASEPPAADTSDIFPAGSIIEVYYSGGHGGARWWRGTVIRTFVSRPRDGSPPTRVIYVRFDASEYGTKIYKYELDKYNVRLARVTRGPKGG